MAKPMTGILSIPRISFMYDGIKHVINHHITSSCIFCGALKTFQASCEVEGKTHCLHCALNKLIIDKTIVIASKKNEISILLDYYDKQTLELNSLKAKIDQRDSLIKQVEDIEKEICGG
jgi:hypothetical protein